jgi:hypothetical protein
LYTEYEEIYFSALHTHKINHVETSSSPKVISCISGTNKNFSLGGGRSGKEKLLTSGRYTNFIRQSLDEQSDVSEDCRPWCVGRFVYRL